MLHKDKKDGAQQDLHNGGDRGCQTDAEQRHRLHLAHCPRYGEADADAADNALQHNKGGVAAAVEIAAVTSVS